MDAAGRLVIPKEVRREAGLRAGIALDVRWQNGRIEIEPAASILTLNGNDFESFGIPDLEVLAS